MTTTREGSANTFGFKETIAIAGLVGLAGGALFGIWDSASVLVIHAPRPVPLREILSLSAYSVALSSIIGSLGVTAVGVITAALVRIGRYSIRKSQLAGVFAGVFALFAIYVLLAPYTLSDNILEVAESTVICLLSGMGLASLSIFALDRGASREGLVAVGIASFFSLLILVYGGLWVNLSLLSEEALFRPARLLANTGLLLFTSLFGFGLYILVYSVVRKCAPRRTKQAGSILLALSVCALVSVSLTGPLSFGNSSKAEASPEDGTGAAIGLQREEGRPNILWIVMDTVRADHLSSYGYFRSTTPNIDRIAAEGVLFEQAISAAPWTLPSHASMFTGMFPSKHGTDGEHLWLDDGFHTIAEVLHSHGYRTFGYSNNPHVGPGTNLNQGFDAFEVTPYGQVEAGPELTDLLRISGTRRLLQNLLLTEQTPLSDKGARRANEVVKGWIADVHQAETPFFLFINYMEAHTPYRPPRDHATPFLGPEVSFNEAMRVNQDHYAYILGETEMDAQDFEMLQGLYDGEISYLDFRMGQLFDYLRGLNILDDTLLIITSDHGEDLGEHHLINHMVGIYDTLLHVPLIIRYPESIEAGTRVSKQVQLTDLFPTILDIAGIDWDDEEVQGRSLLNNGYEPGLMFAIAEREVNHGANRAMIERELKVDTFVYSRRLKAIRTEEFKYIWSSDGTDELYNIRQDPGELSNLIEAEPEKVREMKGLLDEWLDSFEPYPSRAVE